MRRNSRLAAAACLLTAATVTLSACSGSSSPSTTNSSGGSSTGTGTSGSASSSVATTGYDSASNNVINPSTTTGGTLNLLSSGDCDSWDPQRTYYGWCFNMERLLQRSLVGYSKVNGSTYTIAPDLATSLGKHNANYTEWTYTLKSGLKFSNGKAITPLDVKYGIERLFASDVINGGPSSYYTHAIKHPANYAGPYKDGDLSTIHTTATTITFDMATSYPSFDYLMALPAGAPVPYKTENGSYKGATYTKNPVSSGPFKFQSYVQNKSLTLVRNPYWSQSTDAIRKPLVNTVVLTVDTNEDDIDNKLAAGQADARADNTVQAAFQSKILTNPSLKANADDPASAFTRYMSVNQTVITNIHCRLAVFYAFDKAAALRVYGGSVAGVIAGSMTPPGILGYDPSYNPYPSGSDNSGDVTKAKSELQQCGQPNGFSTKFAYATPSTKAKNLFVAEQSALGRVGIKVTPVTQDQATYYSSFVGSPANIKSQGIGINIAGWGADFPTPIGFYQSITNGNAILPQGNSNYASLNSPTVNNLIATGKSVTDWQNLDKAVMAAAVYLPLYWGKNLYYRNPRMTNVTSNNALAFGIYDFVNIGVTK